MNARELKTLVYFRNGYERSPESYWLADSNRRWPPKHVVRMANAGLLERCDSPGSLDLFRLSEAGLAAINARYAARGLRS